MDQFAEYVVAAASGVRRGRTTPCSLSRLLLSVASVDDVGVVVGGGVLMAESGRADR